MHFNLRLGLSLVCGETGGNYLLNKTEISNPQKRMVSLTMCKTQQYRQRLRTNKELMMNQMQTGVFVK